MKRTPKFVGLDVHQASTLVSVRQDSGRVIARTIIPTEEEAFVELFRGLRGPVQVAFEEGTQAQWLHDLLTPLVDRVVVCNRRGLPPRHGSKNDRLDADEMSEQLRLGGLKSVFHGDAHAIQLKELTRAYQNLVGDATRAMLRLKALFRARGIRAPGQGLYHRLDQRPQWLGQLTDPGARLRAEVLWTQLDLLRQLRPRAKAAMVAEARRDPAWTSLRSVPFLGPVRVALLLAELQTPWRFRSKRRLWAYAGLAVVTRSSADYHIHDGRPVRRRRPPMTRGLNTNHNRVVKQLFKSAATAAAAKAGPLRDWYQHLLTTGMDPALARVTLTRKLVAITLHLWKTGDVFDAQYVTSPAS
jgi:transposase